MNSLICAYWSGSILQLTVFVRIRGLVCLRSWSGSESWICRIVASLTRASANPFFTSMAKRPLLATGCSRAKWQYVTCLGHILRPAIPMHIKLSTEWSRPWGAARTPRVSDIGGSCRCAASACGCDTLLCGITDQKGYSCTNSANTVPNWSIRLLRMRMRTLFGVR